MIKTGTGVKRFQDDKNYGVWFDCLLELLKTRDSYRKITSFLPGVIYMIPFVQFVIWSIKLLHLLKGQGTTLPKMKC